MSLAECLPAELRRADTTITPVAVGWSGAAVHRVEAGGQSFMLKLSEERPLASWRHQLALLQRAADAGLAPRVVHTDETRRAVLSAFVVDRSFPLFYGNPATRDAAIVALGQLLRRVHALPLPAAPTPPNPRVDGTEPRDFLARIGSALAGGGGVPAFVGEAIERVVAEETPASDRAPVLSHNDANPTNVVYDGEKLLLLDWDTAGGNEPYYDIATLAVFLRMDDAACRALLAAYDGAPVASLPARFAYDRRLVAAACGAVFVQMARARGHAGSGGETLASTSPLGDVYQQMRTGAVDVATGAGQWAFGLALVKESVAL
ncbi:MAG: phosphotransferase [Myxococcales bacterium]|nr:phosphotransferase [Myxococcales bacterium]